MKKLVLIAAALTIWAAQPALAQEQQVSVKDRGSESVTMGVTTNGATIGYWHKMTADNSLGADLSFDYSDHGHYDSQSYELSPGVRHYFLAERSVSPYIYGAAIARYSKFESHDTGYNSRSESYTAGLQGGVGLEWFPIQSLSIAGHVGLRAQYEKNHNRNNSISSVALPSGEMTTTTVGFTSNDEGFSVGTISSGIMINLYF